MDPRGKKKLWQTKRDLVENRRKEEQHWFLDHGARQQWLLVTVWHGEGVCLAQYPLRVMAKWWWWWWVYKIRCLIHICIHCASPIQLIQFYYFRYTGLTLHTVPLKCKLTVSTRNSILDPRSFRESRIEFRGSSFKFRFSRIESRVSRIEFRVSRHSKKFSRISNRAFEEMI